MNRIFIFSLIVLLILSWSCRSTRASRAVTYRTLDYVTVGARFDSVQTPYIIDLRNGPKRLVFIGCSHTRDSTDRQYAAVEQYFKNLAPQVAFHEGGQLPENLHFSSRSDAITRNGESGFLKFLCDSAGIRMFNGDISDSLEFTLTLQKHPKEDLFLYYMMERLVVPYLNGAYGQRPFEELYPLVINAWFLKPGFPLMEQERSLDYFKALYLQKMGRPFVLEVNADNFEKFDYINGGDCTYCAIGRTSKQVRDSVLLSTLDAALDRYDRILVTFGHGHALAIEPALKKIISRKRKK